MASSQARRRGHTSLKARAAKLHRHSSARRRGQDGVTGGKKPNGKKELDGRLCSDELKKTLSALCPAEINTIFSGIERGRENFLKMEDVAVTKGFNSFVDILP